MNLGEKILDLRKKKGMSQGDLAEVLNVSRQSVSKWETNSSVPDLDKLVKMSEVFDISLDEMVRGNAVEADDNPPKNDNPQKISSLEKRIIAGFSLLGIGIVLFSLLLVLSDFLSAITLASPFLLTGIIHLLVRKHTGLWCGWTLYLLVSQYLLEFTSARPFWGIFQRWIYQYGFTYSVAVTWAMAILFGILILLTYRAVNTPAASGE